MDEADAVLVTPVRHTGAPAICPLLGKTHDHVLEEDGDDGDASLNQGDNTPEEEIFPESSEESCSSEGSSSEDTGSESSEHTEDGLTRTSIAEDRTAGERSNDGDDEVEVEKSQQPYFMYQRRKFILAGEEREEGRVEGESFGLAKLPVGWPLER